jgi:adenosine kinase
LLISLDRIVRCSRRLQSQKFQYLFHNETIKLRLILHSAPLHVRLHPLTTALSQEGAFLCDSDYLIASQDLKPATPNRDRMMNIILTGSIAFDYLMTFPGHFKEHILPERLDRLSLSFLVESLIRRPGGIAANIAYTMALLGEHPKVMATVGPDFEPYLNELQELGVDTSTIRTIPDVFTASFFVSTDRSNAQIASFFPGAMAHASEVSLSELDENVDLVVISPNDPQAMSLYIQECKSLNIPYAYDPSQQIVRMGGETLKQGLIGSDMLFANDYEIALIEEKTGLTLDDLKQQIRLTVMTRGENGTEIYSPEGHIHIDAVEPTHIADPTGVGDAFRAGFLKGYMNGGQLDLCGQIGALSATFCLESDSPQGHKFTTNEFLSRFLQCFGDESDIDDILK